jgi:hypothetical protein
MTQKEHRKKYEQPLTPEHGSNTTCTIENKLTRTEQQLKPYEAYE